MAHDNAMRLYWLISWFLLRWALPYSEDFSADSLCLLGRTRDLRGCNPIVQESRIPRRVEARGALSLRNQKLVLGPAEIGQAEISVQSSSELNHQAAHHAVGPTFEASVDGVTHHKLSSGATIEPAPT
jgi:hypothetical protein